MTNHNHNPIEALKNACHDACHERHACTHGYKELMQSQDATSIAAVWRKYWRELVSEQYADIICEELPHHYYELKDGFNRAGVFFNECPSSYMNRSFVLIGNSDNPIHIYGHAEAHVLGNALVIAHDHARVSCVQPQGKIELLDYSQGDITAGYTIARNRSSLHAATDCECYNSSVVTITHGILTDHGHLRISAYQDALVDSFTENLITLYDNATLTLR